MAGSTYSVNLALDTKRVEAKLKTLKKQVDDFRKTLSAPIKVESRAQQIAEKKRKAEDRRGTQMARNARLGHQIRKLEEKGFKLEKAKEQIRKAATATDKKLFESARARLKFANDEVKAAQKLLDVKIKGQQVNKTLRSDVFGVPFPTNLRANQKRKRAGFQSQIDILEAQGIDVSAMRRQMGKITEAQNQPIRAQRGLGGKIESVDSKGRLVGQMLGKGTNVGMLRTANTEMQRLIDKAHAKLKLEKASEATIRGQNKALSDQTKKGVNPASPIGGTRYMMGSPAQLAYSGGPSSPIAGARGMAGSPLNKSMWADVRKSALISGGFPLLFGQGPGVALAGGLGGALGERVSKGGGFAGGIAATAAISLIQQATSAVVVLGQAMGPFAEDASAVAAATGNTNTVRGRQLQLIEKLQGKQAAFNAAMEDMENVVGKRGVKALQQFGSDTQRLANDWARFMTQMSAGFAKILNWSGLFAEGTKSKVKRAKLGSFAAGGYDKGDDPKLDALLMELEELQSKPAARGSANRVRGRKVRDLENKIGRRVDLLDKDPKYSTKNRLDAEDHLNQKLERSLKLYKDIGDTIRTGLVDSISAAIDGTKSLGEIAGNVFRQIQNALLQYGVQALLGSIGPKGGFFNKMFGFADGGRPPTGRPSIVGERGPELFVPDSAGTIIPNEELMGGNVTVNVDASGSAVEGDAGQSARLGKMLGAAIQAELIKQRRPGGLLRA